VSTSPAETLRTYTRAIKDFLALSQEATSKGKFLWWGGDSPELAARAETLLQTINNLRQEVVVAGVTSGQEFGFMRDITRQLYHSCSEYKKWEHEVADGGPPHQRLVTDISDRLDILDDLAAIAAAQSPAVGKRTGPKPGPNDGRDGWIYDELQKEGDEERPLDDILRDLNKQAKSRGWEPIESVQGLRQAAIRYAARQGLPRPRNRRPT
jgi:hypothetical protein